METEKKVEPKKSPRFIHFGWYGQSMQPGKKKHGGVLTVAFRQKVTQLFIGFVFCSPNDNFSRKEGRNEALKIMRNSPIVIPIPSDTSNRSLVMNVVNWLCGIGPMEEGWVVPATAIHNYEVSPGDKYTLTETSRIPGWAKKWWIKLLVDGNPMENHERPKSSGNCRCDTLKFGYTNLKPQNIFKMPVSEFIKQAREVGLDLVIV